MSAIRDEIQNYIDTLPDEKLEALKPILTLLSQEEHANLVEADLSKDEKEIIRKARLNFAEQDYISLTDVNWNG